MWTCTSTQHCVIDLARHWRSGCDRPTDFGPLGSWSPRLLLEFVRGCDDLSQRDRIARQLITLAQAGHAAADQLLLVAMLPRVVHLTRSCRGLRGLPLRDAEAIAVGAMWEAVHACPAHAQRALLHRLGMDALGIITRTHTGQANLPEVATDPELLAQLDPAVEEGPGTASEDLGTVLQWALDRAVITGLDLRVIAAIDLGEPGDRELLAAELGVAAASLTRRAHRLRRRLRAAVEQEIASTGRW